MKSKKKLREDVVWWMETALEDYESARVLYKEKRYSKSIHIMHNAVEKMLKAAMLSLRMEIPRGRTGHILTHMYGKIKMQYKLPENLEEVLRDLSPLYMPTEYPDSAFGVPYRIYGKEYAVKYITEVGEILKCLKPHILQEK
jgi:HEPN domain-containing protein